MYPSYSLIFSCIWLARVNANFQDLPDKAVFDALFNKYDKRIRPAEQPANAVSLRIGVQLSKIIKVDSKAQELTTNLRIYQEWKDPNLKWNKSIAQGVEEIFVDPSDIWTPDIALMNK
ncbi:acetylcholine receptor subunit alpha-like [Nematostella vectensis]|uniref:acetylcholine receptor subunit alpha-like n=1 Tax=Nematostella vectensis TaxID=45351 RepID=UPI002077857A|nr:acetylcholine receptor subunit alpha-like [Nematostella vectensis]